MCTRVSLLYVFSAFAEDVLPISVYDCKPRWTFGWIVGDNRPMFE